LDLRTGHILAKYLVSPETKQASWGLECEGIFLSRTTFERLLAVMSDVVNASLRGENEAGTRACRRLRKSGYIPAVLYGHKEAVISLKVKPTEVMNAIKAGHKVVDLKGDVNESVLLKDVQWDALGYGIVHVDFSRVSATESVQTTVAVELRGTAPGIKEGGVLKFVTHEIEVECAASAIPDKIYVSVKDLQLDSEIFARDVALPEGVTLVSNGDDVIVSCDKPRAEEEEEAGAPTGAEPELIRKEKAAEEEGD
jgi:large subunit ribosomal protein L25